MTVAELKKWKDRAKKCSEIYKNAGKDLYKAKVTIPVGAFEDLVNTAIKSREAWEKIDDDIASLQDIYSIGGADTEKAIWENLQAVRKTIHEYLKEVSK